MADPFEVRIKFTSQLQHLNASVTSAQKTAYYAIKHKDMDEDLHSCILEQLERNTLNNRANIMYFLEQLCDLAQREGHTKFIDMVQRDILHIIDAAAPADGSGAANVKVVRKVIAGMQSKNYLTAEKMAEINDCLKDRETVASHPALPEEQEQSQSEVPSTVRPSPSAPAQKPQSTSTLRHDKRQIEQRIEEDRERHKRLRESMWAVNPEGNAEFERLWDDASDIGEDDLQAAEEDAMERKRAEILVE